MSAKANRKKYQQAQLPPIVHFLGMPSAGPGGLGLGTGENRLSRPAELEPRTRAVVRSTALQMRILSDAKYQHVQKDNI